MQTTRTRRLLPLVLTAWLGAFSLGCVLSQATDGTSLPDEQVARIEIGKSSRADVTRLLGAPDKVIYSNLEHDPLFERAFQYKRTRRKSTFFTLILLSGSRSDTNVDNVLIFFDDRGVVEDVGARLDMGKPRFAWPWSDGEGGGDD